MSRERSNRRLAAILAADVVGYSGLMGVDERGTHLAVKRLRVHTMEPLLLRFRGRLIKTTGDGFLFEFGSVFDAFDFGAAVQAEGSEQRALQLRMGLNIGDVIMDEGDVFGDGVNIAARLEPKSPTGGIMVSNRAWEDLRKLPLDFDSAGPLELKNIKEPVPAWSLSAEQLRTYAGMLDGETTEPAGAKNRDPTARPIAQENDSGRRLRRLRVGAVSLMPLLAAGAWFVWRPSSAAVHAMEVRLAGFQLLSADLPATMSATVRDEIVAAFNEDGVVGVSTASAPASGTAPAYALGGTIQRDGQKVRVITRLTNERSGTTLWSDSFNYDANQASRVPRHIAVDAGNVVRCGLFGASTYRKTLPDPVLRDYMQFCQGHWNPYLRDGRKALVPAQRVVAAAPDFSWGWAAVAGAFWKVAISADDSRVAEKARESGRQAADRAIAVDSKNSEALWIKSLLIDRHNWVARENLLKRAVAARSLDCGCEHHQYGSMLADVGRVTEAVEQLRQANEMLALYVFTPFSLAMTLLEAGKPEEAQAYFEAAMDLAPDSSFAEQIKLREVTEMGDYEARARALMEPELPMPSEVRTAMLKAYRALASRNSEAKAQAVQVLLALPEAQQDDAIARLVAELGATHDAFQIATRLVTGGHSGPSLFWTPIMRRTLSDPGFPAVASRLGLINYWKTTHTRPDVCNERAPPPFCRTI